MIENVLWTEKYRPRELDGVALSPENRALLQAFIDKGEIPHILLHGQAGTGKTTTAHILISKLDCAVLSLNASNERGIDVVREKVNFFVRGMSVNRWRIVFLDEADAMTADAQFALRNLMESYANQARFILTCNHVHKIIDPLQSRCTSIVLSEMPLKERVRVLQHVLSSEGVPQSDPKAVLSYAERYTDMRKLLSTAQKVYLAKGTLVPAQEAQVTGTDLYAALVRGDYKALVAAVNDSLFDPQEALRSLFWAVPQEGPSAAKCRAALARALSESGRGVPDMVIHFLGTCSELMS